MAPYLMSIEIAHGRSAVHGYHLGTDARLARQIIEERFHGRIRFGLPTVTIALMHDGKVIDTYYGDKWHSDLDKDDGPYIERDDMGACVVR